MMTERTFTSKESVSEYVQTFVQQQRVLQPFQLDFETKMTVLHRLYLNINMISYEIR